MAASPSPPRRATSAVGGGEERGGPEEGLAFLEVQRGLLKQLEGLYVSIADDRLSRRGGGWGFWDSYLTVFVG